MDARASFSLCSSITPADRARVVCLQPSGQAHEVEGMIALSPGYRRVISRVLGTLSARIEGVLADSTHPSDADHVQNEIAHLVNADLHVAVGGAGGAGRARYANGEGFKRRDSLLSIHTRQHFFPPLPPLSPSLCGVVVSSTGYRIH